MSITAKELAKKLALSEAAISLALNNKPGVSKKTRNKVLDAALKYGYDFSNRALYASNNKNGTICFAIYKRSGAVVADTPFFSSLSEGISNGCKTSNYNLNIIYIYGNENLENQLRMLESSGFSGIILLATEMHLDTLQNFFAIPLPIIVLDSYFESLPYDSVLINNIQGSFSATSYLISQRKSQPGYLHSSYSIGNFEERADGFFKAIRSAGLSTSKSIVHHLAPSQEGAYADMAQIISTGEELASCYFADNDLIAVGAIRALKEAGYRIPEDIAVVGFDDLPICEYFDPPLTTIHVPKQYMGRTAFMRLVQLIEEKGQQPLKIEINTMLIKRKSV